MKFTHYQVLAMNTSCQHKSCMIGRLIRALPEDHSLIPCLLLQERHHTDYHSLAVNSESTEAQSKAEQPKLGTWNTW